MKLAISYNGSTVFIDSEGKKHLFCPEESRFLRKGFYTWVQKKNEGVLL